MSLYDYRGVLHCHTRHSGGRATVEELAGAATEAGLDFLILNDDNSLKARDEGQEKWYGSTLLICGTEIAPASGNHYLALGSGPLKGLEGLKDRAPQEVVEAVAKAGWLGFLAHPDDQGSKRFGVAASPWTAWETEGFTGISLWTLVSDFLTQFDRDNVTFEDYKEFENTIAGPRTETVQRWDRLCQSRKVVGVGELNNHERTYEFNGQSLEVFPYATALRTVTNHVLLREPLDKDPAKAREQVLGAFRDGRLYISFDFWDDPTDFTFEIDSGTETAGMGDEIVLGREKNELVVTLPEEALINVFHNGESIHEDENDEVLIEIDQPGVYRIEAMRDNLTWILSNPIWAKK